MEKARERLTAQIERSEQKLAEYHRDYLERLTLEDLERVADRLRLAELAYKGDTDLYRVMEKCGGYRNDPTWTASLWIDNDESSYNYELELVEEAKEQDNPEAALARALEAWITEEAPETVGLYADLLTWAMARIDWREIAVSMLSE